MTVETNHGSHTIKVKLRGDHNYQFVTENGTYYKKCSACGHTTLPQAIPSAEITAPDRVCSGQDCVVTVASESHEWADGVCRECEYTCLHTDTDKDHICDYCKETISDHSGGKATCTEKAVCEVCGKAYGEIDANNHADLKHIEAKAATKGTEGNTEYWYCDGCGKYYSDAAAAREITKADTVTEKLPSSEKSPKTGNTGNLALWLAAAFICGLSAIGGTVFFKRKVNR